MKRCLLYHTKTNTNKALLSGSLECYRMSAERVLRRRAQGPESQRLLSRAAVHSLPPSGYETQCRSVPHTHTQRTRAVIPGPVVFFCCIKENTSSCFKNCVCRRGGEVSLLCVTFFIPPSLDLFLAFLSWRVVKDGFIKGLTLASAKGFFHVRW